MRDATALLLLFLLLLVGGFWVGNVGHEEVRAALWALTEKTALFAAR